MTSSPHNNNEESPSRLSLAGVTVRFGETLALEGITLDVKPGERLAIIGASGAGKSTLFRALTRTVALDGGKVALGERDLYALSKKELKHVRRRVGTIYQAYNLVPQLPAGMNAALGEVGGMRSAKTLRTFLRGPDRALAGRVEAALDRVGLAGLASQRTAELSGGQQQRVAVARLLVQRPDLILADEPFAAVDPVTTERVMEALFELNGEGATLVANLHDVQIARRFPRIVALREGRLVFDGPPEHLTEDSLDRIYAGDPYGTVASQPERDEDTHHRRQDPIRISEGRDGISAH
ncbi:MAG TPA: ATP-binding cassette domain-containing protein [Rubrobacteraceae bacterium]|nr:ATP-binding cassette domain-containing protein [Rubrobacteraceae bacterium]